MTRNPYRYQRDAVRNAWGFMQQGENVVVVSPGGSGKTLMIAMLARLALRARKSVLVLVHRRELITQAVDHLVDYGIDRKKIGVLGHGIEDLPDYMMVCVASLQTYRLRDIEQADIVLVDEAHHAPARTYKEIIERHARGTVAGFTATLVRMDGVGFEEVFDKLLVAATMKQLLRSKRITAPVCWGPVGELPVDLSSVPVRGGDYATTALSHVMNRDELVGNTVTHYKKHGGNQQAIGFAVSVEHTESLAKRFRNAGISSTGLHGKMSEEEQLDVLARFKRKDIRVLWTCQLANEGLNIPEVRVVIMARPTKSFVVYQQQAARCMRPGTKPILLDHAGNVLVHGLPYIDRQFSLSGLLEEVPVEATAKECPDCGNMAMCGSMVCEECAYEFPVPAKKEVMSETDESLVKVSYAAFARRVKSFARKHKVGDAWVQRVIEHYRTGAKPVSV